MNRLRWKKLLSSILLIAGAVLFVLGARTILESFIGQSAAARDFRTAASTVSAATSSTPSSIHAPHRGDIVARLTIPRLTAVLFVVEGDDAGDLRIGPGHITGSAMPGTRGNCVIAGHRDTHFRVLKDLRKGDEIKVCTGPENFVYHVDSISVVAPSNVASLQPTSRSVLHLVTCYPFSYVGAAPQRLVVEASLAK
jgi:sortase A